MPNPGGRRVLLRAAPVALLLTVATWGMPTPGAAAASSAPTFDAGVRLGGQGGAEPSMAIDHTRGPGRDSVYVAAIGGWGSSPPPGDPPGSGPVVWRSTNHGASFGAPVPFDVNGPLRGEDADVAVDGAGNVVVADLNVTHSLVQVSTDHGATFNTGTVTAPEDDRPWLTAHGSDVYVFYHDFAGELPGVCTSHDGGNTFLPCSYVTLTDPVILSNCLENTNVAKGLAVDPVNGSINILFACSTLQGNLANPPYGSLHDYYLAQSTDGGLTFTDYPVFKADVSNGKGPSYGNFWPAFAIDAAGNYYGVWAGTADDPNVATNPYHIFMVASKDHGHTWSAPVVVDQEVDHKGTHVEAAIAAGAAGNVDIAWYGTTATGEPNGVCESSAAGLVGLPPSPCPGGLPIYSAPSAPAWNVYMAQATDATAPSPSFQRAVVSTSPVHYGEICVNGIVCGSSDRSLLDFISVGLDCTGMAHIAYATNTKAEEAATSNANGAAAVRVSNQVGGAPLGPPAECGSVAAGPSPSALPNAAPAATAELPPTSDFTPRQTLSAGLLVLALVSLVLGWRRTDRGGRRSP